jgi:hypothetical protein
VGSERVKKGIIERKLTDTGYPPRDWVPVHRMIWEQHHGPVPAGHIVIFRNRDRRDFRIENLDCISKAENMRRNTIHNMPPALRQVCQLRGVLNRRIHEKEGSKNDEK